MNSLKIALIGYGKMGRMIEKVALDQKHRIVAAVDSKNFKSHLSRIQDADVCIECTRPESVLANVECLAEMGKTIVVGTTGWHEQLPQVKMLVEKYSVGLLYGSNFSVGFHLFHAIVKEAAQLMNAFPEYDVAGFESHHEHKLDSPSGATKILAATLLANIRRKQSVVYELGNRQRLPQELQFSSLRCGSIPGTHTIMFDSPADSITVTHQARNREGFAYGAIKAAEWLQGKTGLYSFEQMLADTY